MENALSEIKLSGAKARYLMLYILFSWQRKISIDQIIHGVVHNCTVATNQQDINILYSGGWTLNISSEKPKSVQTVKQHTIDGESFTKKPPLF